MDLQISFDRACAKVTAITERNEKLREELSKSEKELQDATNGRNNLRSLMSVIPSTPKLARSRIVNENLMEDRQAVFQEMRKIPGIWIMPHGVAILANVDDSITSGILRRASKLPGVPIEHNGLRGRGSMYRWLAFNK